MSAIGKAVAKAVASVAIAAAVLAGGLYLMGMASASSGSPSPSASTGFPVSSTGFNATTSATSGAGPSVNASAASTERTAAGQAERPRLLEGAIHADITALYVDGSTRSLAADRGRIQSLDNGTIVLGQPGGQTVSVPTNDATCIRKDGQPASLQDLEVGARATLLQENGVAVVVRSGRPEPGIGRQPCGVFKDAVHADITVRYLDGSTRTFAYDRGQITSITDTQITLTRRDGKVVTESYDGSTIVRENGQTESVSDLTVGERAMVFSEGGLAKLIRCVTKASAT